MEHRAQIAVIGAGASGMAAAASAAEAGASVIILETNAAVGGNGIFPRGIFAVDSPIQRKKLVFAETDAIFTQCMEYSHWKPDARIIRALLEKSGETILWLMEKGVEFSDVVHHTPNQTPEVYHITAPPLTAGKAVIQALKNFCLDKGASILTRTRARELTRSAQGNINGVRCDGKNGETVTVNAESVILCTGGFSGNTELISRFYPRLFADIMVAGTGIGGMRHKGDGLLMATQAGADIEGNFAMEIAAPKIKGHAPLNLLLGKPGNVWVNSFGRRFADEGIVYDFSRSANACLRQPGAAVWVIFDEAAKNAALADGPDAIERLHMPPDALNQLEEHMARAREEGIMLVAERLEELAAFIGCDTTVFVESMKEYNRFCVHNRDALFAKARRHLKALETPPYYAIRAGADMLATHGGIRVNERFNALDKNHEPVPGLYVAGVDFGGADADVYNMSMSGHGFGFAVNSGRIAGENAVRAISL